MADLFNSPAAAATDSGYSAKDIEVLEGLEPVRRRPGMYIGGTDDRAMHHLAAEVLDNSMDEAVAGHASRIEFELGTGNMLTVRDNGRGIPVDPHPKYTDKSALEVILTTLHSGGKFSNKVYETSGGLHGVGISVVNALSDLLEVEIARDRRLWRQTYSKGAPTSELKDVGAVSNRRGTTISFRPDPEIFGARAELKPATLYRMARSKAYLYKGVEVRWRCAPELLKDGDETPESAVLHFPGGLADYLEEQLKGRKTITPVMFSGHADFPDKQGRVEWAVAWPLDDDGFFNSYCNTIPTPEGGTHESGIRTALLRGLKGYGELIGNKQSAKIMAEDVVGGACGMLSAFIPDPQFQGQTKDKLTSANATRLVEAAIKDHFDHWLSADSDAAKSLLERAMERADARRRRKAEKETKRQTATRRLRLPGKLADCTRSVSAGTELFLVEGDSAGGSAKQARDRATQAVLPLRGKILNVASASRDKLKGNQELTDLLEALGCGAGKDYDDEKLRYEKVIILTDADVDGAHIASLLMTFFYKELPGLVENGHLYLGMPPLYRLVQGSKSIYARDDAHKDQLLSDGTFKGKGKIEISRFKGLGEMPPPQLRETTMNRETRQLLKVSVPTTEDRIAQRDTEKLVDDLMGRNAEKRFNFIQDRARFVEDLDI
jgi:topoisomerase-4 subunit B